MNILCDSRSLCVDPAEPTSNYSTEDPDINHLFCYGSSNGSVLPGVGRNWAVADCNVVWGPVSCVGETEDECRACLQTYQWTCGDNGTGVDPVTPPIVDPTGKQTSLFGNRSTSCASTCPDGLEWTFVLPANQFWAASQYQADRIAYNYACQQARQRRVCLSDLSNSEACINSAYSATINAVGAYVSSFDNNWVIVLGTLPPGLTLNGGFVKSGPSVAITGTPTTAGTYDFTLRVTAPNGDYMQKNYRICVIDIVPDSPLLDGTVGTAYSQALVATTCAAFPQSFTISAGALPPGLTLDEETGLISGTPTTAGTYNFTVLLQTEAS